MRESSPPPGCLLLRLGRVGLHGYGVGLLQQAYLRPDRLYALGELGGVHGLHVRQLVHPQPHEQGLGLRHGQLLPVQLAEHLAEAGVAGGEGLALGLCPAVVGLIAQSLRQLGVVPRAAETHAVELGQVVKIQKLVVHPHAHVVRVGGDEPHHARGYAGRAVAPHDAHPLVPLLHVELAHVLVAAYGVVYPLVAQVGRAEAYPLGGELRLHGEQGHVVGGKGQAALCVLGAHYLLRGYVHHAQVHAPDDGGLVQQLVEHAYIRVVPVYHAAAAVFLPQLEGSDVLLIGFRSVHIQSPILNVVIEPYRDIIYPPGGINQVFRPKKPVSGKKISGARPAAAVFVLAGGRKTAARPPHGGGRAFFPRRFQFCT